MINVAVLGPDSWALGSISSFLTLYLSRQNDFNVVFLDWDKEDSRKLAFESFDVVIAEAHVLTVDCSSVYDRLIAVWHAYARMPGKNIEESSHTHDMSSEAAGLENLYGITRQVSYGDGSVFDFYGKHCSVLPIGVDLNHWGKRSVDRINTVGGVFAKDRLSQEKYTWNKRPEMFFEIAGKAGVGYKVLDGVHYLDGPKIYEGVDMVINTSINEGNPLALLECSAGRIPFISAGAGLASEYDCVKKFSSTSEAADIIKWFNSDPRRIEDYVEELYEKVAVPRDWEKIVDLYWAPEIRKKHYENTTCLRL